MNKMADGIPARCESDSRWRKASNGACRTLFFLNPVAGKACCRARTCALLDLAEFSPLNGGEKKKEEENNLDEESVQGAGLERPDGRSVGLMTGRQRQFLRRQTSESV